MRNLNDIIKYIIETKSNIRYFVINIDMENPRYNEIDISYVSKNGNCCDEEFEDIIIDIDLKKMFQILRDNHFDVVDSDRDVTSIHATNQVAVVFTNILNIERIQLRSDDTYVVFLNNNFPNNGKKFYIDSHPYLREIFASHSRYDLALML